MPDGLRSFRTLLESGGALGDDDWRHFAAIAEPRTFEKGHVVLRPGDDVDTVFFVVSGLLRLYTVTRGREATRNFFDERTLFTESLGYFLRKPTRFFLQTLEASELLVFHRADLNRVFGLSLPLARAGLRLIEGSMAALAGRVAESLIPKGPARYLALRAARPELFQRVPQYMIASYLGLSPEALSRIITRSP